MSGIDDTTKLVTLFKKGLGYTNIVNNNPLASEYPANALPSLMLDKLFTQTIPIVTPTTFGTTITSPVTTIGLVKPAAAPYEYVVKYENVKLTSYNSSPSVFIFSPTGAYPNLLKNIIPFNYNPNGGYDVKLKASNGSPVFKENYILDRDAGILRIVTDNTASITATNPPIFEYFWRYEGTLGDIASASSGGSSSTFISTATSDLNMSSFRITNLSAPFSTMDAVNKLYVDNLISDISSSVISTNLAKWAQYKAISTLDMSGFQIKNVSAGVDASDAVNYAQLMSGLASKLDLSGAAMQSNLNMSSFQINNLSAGTAAGDAVNYQQLMSGLASKLDASGGIMRSDLNMSSFQIKNVSAGTVAGDAVNYQQLMSGLAQKLDLSGGRMSGLIDMSGYQIKNLGWATDGSGAVSLEQLKDYVPAPDTKGQYLYYNGTDGKWKRGGDTVLIGTGAVANGNQLTNAIAIGKGVASAGQNANAIAIGTNIHTGSVAQGASTIIINASNSNMEALNPGFYVKPIKRGLQTSMLYYNTSSGEITYADVSGGTIIAGTYGGWTVYDTNADGTPDKTQIMTTTMDVDMNGNRLQNVGIPTTGSDAARYADVQSLTSTIILNYLNINGTKAMAGTLDMSTNRITNLGDASTITDAVSLKYLSSYLSSFMRITPGTSTINAGGNQISNVSAGTSALDAVNYQQLMSGLALKLDASGGVMRSDLDMSGFAITNLLTPGDTDLSNAATVKYVQDYVSTYGGSGSGSGSATNWSLTPAVSDVNMSSFRIKNLSTPVSTMDAVNKGYVDVIDAWLNTYVRNKPPAPTQINVSPPSTTSEMYLAFANPLQKNYGISTRPLPVIDTISFKIGSNIPLNNNTVYIPEQSKIDLIIVTNNPAKDNVRETRSLDLSGGGTKSFTAYYIYDATYTLATQITGPINVELWYDNNSDYYNADATRIDATSTPKKLSVTLPGYITAGPPSVPRNLAAVASYSQTEVKATWTAPQYADATNSTIPGSLGAPTLSYKLTATPSATIRYGGLYSTVPTTDTSITSGTALPVPLPGTDYTTMVAVKNSLNSTYVTAVAPVTTSTQLPTAPSNINGRGISIPSTAYPNDGNISYKFANNTTGASQTAALLKAGTNVAITTIGSVGIHTDTNAASTANDIMSVTAYIGSTAESTASFGGFGTTGSDAVNITGDTTFIEISGTTIADVYSGASAGFYKDATIGATIKTAGKASSSAYALKLTQTNNEGTYNTGIGYFRVDSLTTVPTAIVQTFTGFADTQVCGVKILNNANTLSATVDVNNAADYYAPDANVLSYTVKGINGSGSTTYVNTTLNDFSKVTTTINNLPLPIPNTITYGIGGIATNITSGSFYSTISFNATPRNLVGTGTENTMKVSKLIDYDSIILASETSGSIPSITSPTVLNINPLSALSGKSYVTGLRIKSAPSDGSNKYPNYTGGTGITLYPSESPILSNTSDLLTTYDSNCPELQIIDGSFQTKSSSSMAYIDYNNFGSVNYSSARDAGAPAVRFATFIWKVPKNATNGGTFNGAISNLVLRITGIKNSGSAATLSINSSTSGLVGPGGQAFYLYHRTAEFDSKNIGVTNHTTIWADDINDSIYYNPVLGGNAFNTGLNGTLGGRTGSGTDSVYFASGEARFKLNTDSAMNATKDAYVFVRIGLDMTSTMSFERVQLGIC